MKTQEEIDHYYEVESARIADAYAEGRIRRATMLGALRKLAADCADMTGRIDDEEAAA